MEGGQAGRWHLSCRLGWMLLWSSNSGGGSFHHLGCFALESTCLIVVRISTVIYKHANWRKEGCKAYRVSLLPWEGSGRMTHHPISLLTLPPPAPAPCSDRRRTLTGWLGYLLPNHRLRLTLVLQRSLARSYPSRMTMKMSKRTRANTSCRGLVGVGGDAADNSSEGCQI